MDLLDLTALELGKKIQAGEVTAPEAAAAALRRIREMEPSIHAYVTVDEEGAMAQAETVQREIEAGRLSDCRGYHLIQIVGSNAKFIRIILNRVLLFRMDIYQIHEFTYMVIRRFSAPALFYRSHFKISPVQKHQDFIKQRSQYMHTVLLIRINLHLYMMQNLEYTGIKLIGQMQS